MSIDAVSILAAGFLCAMAAAAAAEPGTSFQTAQPWSPEHDIRSEAAIVYSSDKETMDSWARHGYQVQTMGGFRLGPDFASQHPEDVQTARDGTQLTCGPGSFYLAPTERRVQAMVNFFLQAIRNGSAAVIPEEPEYFASAGYEQSFKDAWQREYGQPWEAPDASMDARIKAERLKGKLELHMIRSILQAAEREKADVRRMVAHHSPLNYHSWGISFPFDDFRMMPELQEVIGQVWTGTARSPVMYRGQLRERTFENALLEYSSLVELYRESGKRLWFLADPLEDSPDRTMEDYRTNYSHTLVASLLFTEVNAYELLPWPNRIFGRIPPEYATALGAAFHALGDISKQPTEPGPRSDLGVFTGDSAAYQRAEPHASDLTGFYGLSMPFVYKGVPVRVAPIERSTDGAYLDSFKVLALSYDYFKPMKPEYNTAIAKWVKNGGRLLLVGGSNAYNQANQWWKQQGFSSPDEHLLKELGLSVKLSAGQKQEEERYGELMREKNRVTDMSNEAQVEIPLQERPENVLVRFSDSLPADGWGANVSRIAIETEAGKETITPGSKAEKEILYTDAGSSLGKFGRFADGSRSFTYLFRNTREAKSISITVSNQALVEWRTISDAQLARGEKDRRTAYATTAFKSSDATVMPFERETDAWGSHISSRGFIAAVGKGSVEFLDLPAEAFAHEAGPILLEAAGDAYAANNQTLPVHGAFQVKRGDYVAAHAQSETLTLEGKYVDLLNDKLPVLSNPAVKPGESRFFREWTASRQPALVAGGYQWRLTRSDEIQMSFEQQGPAGVTMAARIDTAGRKIGKVFVKDADGKMLSAQSSQQGDSAYVSFARKEAGPLTVSLVWKAAR